MSQNQNRSLTIVPTEVIQNEALLVKNSFTQDERHVSKSEKFVPVCPKWGQEILGEYGYFLKSLNSGRARKLENAAHQTTVATYQNETPQAVGDIFARITLKIPHIYGAIVPYWGFLRLSCLNGNALKLAHSNLGRIAHTGNALSQFENTVRTMVGQVDYINDSIREMMAREVNPSQVADFVKQMTDLRLGQIAGLIPGSVRYDDLLKVRRATDSGRDAFTVYQVVQENLMRYGLRYQIETAPNAQGITSIQSRVARPISRTRAGEFETSRSVDLNASLWDGAREILMGGKAA